jgi:hypothetical protein
MSVLGFFEWCEATSIGVTIRESLWAFAVIESVHLLGLAIIGGAVIMLNLRLLGLGLRSQPIPAVAAEVRPWVNWSVGLMLLSGVALFLSEPMKLYYSGPFWVKMESLALALIFTYTVWRRVGATDESRIQPIWRYLTAIVSLILWFGVGAGGRWIGFSG